MHPRILFDLQCAWKEFSEDRPFEGHLSAGHEALRCSSLEVQMYYSIWLRCIRYSEWQGNLSSSSLQTHATMGARVPMASTLSSVTAGQDSRVSSVRRTSMSVPVTLARMGPTAQTVSTAIPVPALLASMGSTVRIIHLTAQKGKAKCGPLADWHWHLESQHHRGVTVLHLESRFRIKILYLNCGVK